MQGMAHGGRHHSPVYGTHSANRRDVGRRDSRGEAGLVLYDAPDVRGTDHSSNQCNHKLEADDHEGDQTFPTTHVCIYHDVTGWAGTLRRKDGKMKTRTIIIIVILVLSTVLPVQQGGTQGALETQTAVDMPIGSITAYAGSEAPDGWLLCDGELYEAADFPELFEVIGFTYGGNPAKTAFRVPDLTGRIPVGADPTRWYCKDLGQTGGEEEVTLTEDQMPSHRHDVTVSGHSHEISVSPHTHAIAVAAHTHSIIDPGHSHSVSDPGHSHGITDPGHSHTIWLHDHLGQGQVDDSGVNHRQDTQTSSSKTGISVNKAVTNISITKVSTGIAIGQTSPTASAASATVSASAQSVVVGVSEASKGSDASHNNLQPYIVVNYIIKYQ